ncbi:KaiC domain-containing protein [Halarchaeum sp. CBA1220]|uniref:KaiC domain-containing protein n=1 Tax=Halarchaeum sp. CBA1220 TaxID=1853682 RepID=UPI000F3A89FE|nr:KaiC domain-containing protein [Halarchaeum sp. CBA1220]QLC33030.1 KaiC domain-containing protein [Halarchaeum sp. CBA1220]
MSGDGDDDWPDDEDEPDEEDAFADAFAGDGPDDGDDFGFGGGGGGGDDFGFDAGGDDPDPSEFGFGGGGGGGDEFEEEFESDIPRIEFGVEGLDNMVQGGIPQRSLLVTIGGAGTGKTTFGLQFLEQAVQNGEKGVFITLEESYDRIVQSAAEKGWPFEEYVQNDQLAVIDLDPIEMANSLSSIRSELPHLIEEFGADRLVLDSVSLLEMMYDDQATRRTEIYDFTKALKRAGVTTLLTSEASDDNAFASRHGIIEYLTDGVVVLRYVRPEDFRETRLAVEIQKIRDANHSRETKPYEITNSGISVYRQANIF